MLSVKLRHLERWQRCRRVAVAARYRTELRGTGAPRSWSREAATPVHYLEVLLVPDRDAVLTLPGRQGIECGLHYPVPCHRQPAFAADAGEALPVAEAAAEHILSLPMWPGLTTGQVDRVCEVVDGVGA